MPTADAARPRVVLLASLALVLALVGMLFARSLQGGFVYDDLLLVQRNPATHSLAGAADLFTQGMWDFVVPASGAHVGYWRPLAGLALLLGHALDGGDPAGFHAVSIALHLLATALCFALALRLTQNRGVALFSALLFGLHPVHVESVAWISAVNDPLFGALALAALLAYVRWREHGTRRLPWLAGGLFLCALLAKELALAVVPIALALELARTERSGWKQTLRPLIPFALAVLLWYAARAAVFGDLRAGFEQSSTEFGVSPARLAQLRIELFGGFLWLASWPFDLKFFHPFQPALALTSAEMLRALGCSAVFTMLAVLAWKKRWWAALSALAILGLALLPVLVRVDLLGIFPLSERYLYLPVFGLTLGLCLVAYRWLPNTLAAVLLGALALAWGWRSFERIPDWRDEETLFKTAVQETPRSPYVHWGLGRVLLERYREHGDAQDLGAALESFTHALNLLDGTMHGDTSVFSTRNDHVQTHLGMAWCYLYEAEGSGYAEDASAYDMFKKVARWYPDNDQAWAGMGVSAAYLGRAAEAEELLRKAVALNPRAVEAQHNLGLVLLQKGDINGARQALERALELRPEHLDDLLWLARAQIQSGAEADAHATLARAKQHHPEAVGPLVLEGSLLAQKGKIDEALDVAKHALELAPDDGEALLLSGKLHLRRGEKAAAEELLTRAADRLPASFEAHYNVGVLLLERVGPSAAAPFLLRAYALRPAGGAGETLRAKLPELEFANPATYAQLAAIDVARNENDAAERWIAKALAADEKQGFVHLLAATVAARHQDDASAEKSFRRAYELMPKSLDAAHGLGQFLFQRHRYAEAKVVLLHALELVSQAGASDRDALFMRSSIRDQLQDIEAGTAPK